MIVPPHMLLTSDFRATLSLASVVPHLDHFCAVLPNGNHGTSYSP
jgi:hypothetical protein